MKSIDKSLSLEYGCVTLFVNSIRELMDEFSFCENIKLAADDVEYDSIEEFTQNVNERPREVRISASNPYVTIELSQRWAKLYVSSSQALGGGVFYKVDSILSKCERKPRFFYKHIVPMLSIWVASGLLYAPIFNHLVYVELLFLLLMCSWFLIVMNAQLRSYSKVCPVYRHEQPGFFKRNKDSMIVAIVSALIGAFARAVDSKIVKTTWSDTSGQKVEEVFEVNE